ncbi:TonB-dependent receptor SusC [Adhaeribacter pallidiroseus]|uniref:TonB-dependent receptor SusC n=2 Tax=Adhaeribacter pallidiroseus TaxID=2072847 RepID=A0A369QCZ8_9BACT|nr:TonB-dependent receptor SusC [Adhaeribacter pallidiroseus]
MKVKLPCKRRPIPYVHSFKKLLLMKLMIMLLTVAFLQVSAKASSQSISITEKNTSLEKVFEIIHQQSGYLFIYNNELLKTAKPVSLNLKAVSLEKALNLILEGQPLTYTLLDKTIIIRAKAAPVKEALLNIDVKGKVQDDKGEPLPGVSIQISGTTQGTVTDASGTFTLNAPENASLIFSYIGYANQTVPLNGRPEITITLVADEKMLNEVVVTALGISREKKALAYSVSEVKGDEFTQARENNIANALTGKIAGVNATGLSTGPGGSSRVIIRGNGSLAGSNTPLYVINGMPLDNTTPGGSATTNGGGTNVDRGDGIAGINPDDIESISVLKGGTAAALYGSRAANGVILITTKSGKAQKGIGVQYNSTYTLENVAIVPDWQYEYGQGLEGRKPADASQAIQTGRWSWGAKIDGSEFIAADGKTHPYVAQKNNIKNFYQTGNTFTNTLAFNGGTEALNFRFSLSDLDSKAILPNSTYDRKNATLSLNSKIGKRINIEVLAQYNNEQAHNRPSAGDATGNPNWTPYMIANTVDMRWVSPGYNAAGMETPWNDAGVATNAYFVVNKFKNDDTKNRFIGQASIQFNLLDNLYLKGQVARDFSNYNFESVIPTGTIYTTGSKGEMSLFTNESSETNAMLTANYNTNLSENFGLNVLAGGNRRNNYIRSYNLAGNQFIIPFFYTFSNLTNTTQSQSFSETQTNSVFGSVDLDYKGFAYLTFTGRNDWFSTLSPKNNSIFYPSVGGSFILSQALQLPKAISLAKFRASWAQVGGGGPNPYQINLSYSMVPSSTVPLQDVTSTTISNPELGPLTSTTTEVGMDLQFFNRRLGLDLTLYNRTTTNDIVSTAITPTSGFENIILNVGEMYNKGIETLITGTPVQKGNFTWNTSYNFAYNKNRVVSLAEGLNTIQMATTVNNYANVNSTVGQPYGVITGYTMAKDASGNVIYDPKSGFPVRSPLQQLGNGVAPLTMGLTNEFTYKNFSLNVLLDGKFGNKVFSMMEVYGIRMGLLKMTLPGRENGLEVNGVTPEGAPYSRTVAVKDLRVWYDNYKNYSDVFLHDGSFVKLRQVIFTYNIPANKIPLLKLQGASISFVARNLAILYRKTDNFDPESSFTNGNAQGFESFGLPRTRTMGLNFMLKF